ncbi:MAG: metallophosphoesterase [Candidatus Zixiibacteriota bacterium]
MDKISQHSCLFATDLHGSEERYRKLFHRIKAETPVAVFLGGDLLPSGLWQFSSPDSPHEDFIADFLAPSFAELKRSMGPNYPRVFAILGNDDSRGEEEGMIAGEKAGLWEYIHNKKITLGKHSVYGYACVSPTPFLMKDWERYDVSRYVDPGSISPEEGYRSLPVEAHEIRYGTIEKDLAALTADDDLSQSVLLLHSPPHDTCLDRAGLDGMMVDYVPVPVHVGSIAIRRLIEKRQPLITLHGHIHESARLTGQWRQQIGRTLSFSAAHDGPELALVRFDLENPSAATRELL